MKKPRFGKSVKKKGETPTSLNANDLLQRMRERNRLMPNGITYEGRDLFHPDNYGGFEPNVELLADIRNFVAFQNSSASDGEATTQALVDKFKDKLPPVKNPLFKALLNEICTFVKRDHQSGIWRLKQEFK